MHRDGRNSSNSKERRRPFRVSSAKHCRCHEPTYTLFWGTVRKGGESQSGHNWPISSTFVWSRRCSRFHPSSQEHHPGRAVGTASWGSHREPGYGGDSGHTGVQGDVNWCGKHWEEPASNPTTTWTPPNPASKCGGRRREGVRAAWGQCVCEDGSCSQLAVALTAPEPCCDPRQDTSVPAGVSCLCSTLPGLCPAGER